MKSAHYTLGPWDHDGLTVFYSAPSEADEVAMIEIRADVTADGWQTVAFIEATGARAKADASLIAAAPDMFKALEACEAMLRELARTDDGVVAVYVLLVVRAALAKARAGSASWRKKGGAS